MEIMLQLSVLRRIGARSVLKTLKCTLFLGLLCLFFFGLILPVIDLHELTVYQTVRVATPRWEEIDIQTNSSRMEGAVTLENKVQLIPKRILFYDPATFHRVRNILNISYFQNCEVNDCVMTFNTTEANVSDAVIFHLWLVRRYPNFHRPQGQVWVMIQHEATQSYIRYKRPSPFYRNSFNWTMTYSELSDIHLPYGKLRRRPTVNRLQRDYLHIARSKSKDALWIVSHCFTNSHRLKYARILEQYITLDILGRCGRNWTCGSRHDHALDNCFDILNSTYRYYLAFENNFCLEYITEKFFENYKYDIIQIVRGGDPRTRPINISHDAYISASDFNSAYELGNYLKLLSKDTSKYAKMLETKDKYEAIAYSELFQQGLLSLIFCGIFLTVIDIYGLTIYQPVHIAVPRWRVSFVQSNISRAEGVVESNNKGLKQILFYDPTRFQINRNILNISYFQNCKVNDCEMTFNKAALNNSDAVIFHLWHHLWDELKYPVYQRPRDQVWILIQHEATERYDWPSPFYRNNFNWTMTYSELSDIYLPYGKLRRLSPKTKIKRDYLEIARRKSKDALWIVSHCPTSSQRLEYANILENYITLDVLGKCGRKWHCGTRYHHDRCFDILNSTYRYYLAFENNFCQEYITEKFFENYKYDTILVVRGGNPKQRPINISHNAYISASDFRNAHELGAYLRALSNDTAKYAKMLETKDEYQAIAYSELFQQCMCEICKRLHNIDKYRFVYDDVYQWIKTNEPCFNNQAT